MQEVKEWLRDRLAEPIDFERRPARPAEVLPPVEIGDHVGLNRAQRRALRKVRA